MRLQPLSYQGGRHRGRLVTVGDKIGFIAQDSGQKDMFVLKGNLPTEALVGTRVTYDIVMNPKRQGENMADNVQIESPAWEGSS